MKADIYTLGPEVIQIYESMLKEREKELYLSGKKEKVGYQ